MCNKYFPILKCNFGVFWKCSFSKIVKSSGPKHNIFLHFWLKFIFCSLKLGPNILLNSHHPHISFSFSFFLFFFMYEFFFFAQIKFTIIFCQIWIIIRYFVMQYSFKINSLCVINTYYKIKGESQLLKWVNYNKYIKLREFKL